MSRKLPLIFVAGHQRPDADAAVAACVTARLRQAQDRGHRYQAILLGEANAQTRWIFKQAGVALPPVREDLRYTVGEVMNKTVETLPETARLADALPLLQERQYSMIPIVNDERRVVGILSNRVEQSQYFYHFNIEDFVGQLLTLDDIVAGLGLRKLNRRSSVPMLGTVRLVAGNGLKISAGDIVITGANTDVIDGLDDSGVQAVILADCTPKEARVVAKNRRFPVYYYSGSLLALTSALSLAIPVRNIMATDFVSLQTTQRLDQVQNTVKETPYALPVLGEDRKILGVFSRSEALTPALRPLIVVDHFERTQTVKGSEQTSIVEIIDHHRVGNLETVQPVRVDCRPVGSTSTIIACQYAETQRKIGKADATLLLGAIISDTLLLTSPTTTAIDRKVATELARRAGVKLAHFGREVLRKNDELAEGDPSALVQKDLKEFSHQGVKFAAAQIETVDLGLLTGARSQALVAALEVVRGRMSCEFAALIVTDVLQGSSRMFVADAILNRRDHFLEDADPDMGRMLKGVVSRKKQLLPLLFQLLETYRD